MADPRKPPGSDWDPTFDDAEIFVETPTVNSEIAPLPEADETSDMGGVDFQDDGDTQPGVDDADDRGAAARDGGGDLAGRHPGRRVGARRRRRRLADGRGVGGRGAALPHRERARRRAGGGGAAAAGGGARVRAGGRRRAGGAAVRRGAGARSRTRPRCCGRGRGWPRDAPSSTTRTRCGRGMATAMQSADERAFYGVLSAEWTLARGGKLPPVARQAIPAGPARALAQAEEALRSGSPADVAVGPRRSRARDGRRARCRAPRSGRPLSRGGARSGGGRRRAAEAVKLDPFAPPSPAGRLRDAARADDQTALGLLDELAAGPEGALSMALARWRAAVASRAGDRKRAAALREGLAPVTMAAARDRIDQEAVARRAARHRQPRAPARRDHGRGRGRGAELDRGGQPGAPGRARGGARAHGARHRGQSRRDPARPARPADRRRVDRCRRPGDGVRAVAAQRSGPTGGGGARAGGRPAGGVEREIRWLRGARSRPRSRPRRARRCSGRWRRPTRARGGRPTRPPP